MANLKAPSNLVLSSNIGSNYRNWFRAYEIYALATGVDSKDEKIQCAIFLHVAGLEAQKVHATMTFTDAEKDKIKPLKDKFEAYCTGKTNITLIRYNFNRMMQK